MASNVSISLTSLDFGSLKTQITSWFQTQSIFRDYNFVDSNMSVLIDVLARNTFLNSFYLNMAIGEAFVDSIQLRDSMISKAKEFNYIPYSTKSSTTTVNVQIATANIQTFEIPKGTSFTGTNGNGSYQYVTSTNYVQSSSNGFYTFANVAVYDGFYTNDLFAVDATQNNQIFTLSNQGIDTSSITILVTENSGSNTNYFIQANNLFGLDGNSQVYFMQAAANNKYAFQFGDGVTGYIPQNGSIVTANYRVASGNTADGVSSFSLNNNLGVYNNGTITTINVIAGQNTSGGASIESVDSMRFNIPLHFETQERMVVASDYKTLILEEFPSIKDVAVYSGGVSTNGVTFGIVFISAVTESGLPLTATLKNDVSAYVTNLKVLGPPPNIVDPAFMFVDVTSNVHVDFNKTTLGVQDYITAVTNTIINYNDTYLGAFGQVFRSSKLSDAIDAIDPSSVLSNETSIQLTIQSNVAFNTIQTLNFSFNNPLKPGVNTSQFIYGANSYYITDTVPGVNTTSILYLTQLTPNNTIASFKSTGSVDYLTGAISIQSLLLSSFGNSVGFSTTASPVQKDIYPLNNTIIEIDTVNGLTIQAISG